VINICLKSELAANCTHMMVNMFCVHVCDLCENSFTTYMGCSWASWSEREVRV